jgi:iron complex outermembrane receptor protein
LAYFNISRAAYNTNTVTNTFQQDGNATYSGFETTNTLKLTKEWSIDFAGTLMNAVNHPVIDMYANGMTMPGIARKSGNMAINYYPSSISGLRLTAGAFAAGQKPVDYYNSGYIPGYVTYNIGAGYKTKVGSTPVNYLVAVDNLTNLYYFSGVAQNATTYGVGLPRNIRASVKIDF